MSHRNSYDKSSCCNSHKNKPDQPKGIVTKKHMGMNSQLPLKTGQNHLAWPEVTVAVTGLLGSGKSTVTKMLAARQLPLVDCDAISAELTAPHGEAIRQIETVFGKDMLRPDGGLDRPRMLRRILSDPEARMRLEEILHPLVFAVMDRRLNQIASKGEKAAVVEVPLLFEAGWHHFFTLNCMITAPEELCVKRIVERNGVEPETARSWLRLQMAAPDKEKLADIVIVNDNGMERLKRDAGILYAKIEGMINNSPNDRKAP